MVRGEGQSKPLPRPNSCSGTHPQRAPRQRLHDRDGIQPLERGSKALVERGSSAIETGETSGPNRRAGRDHAIGGRPRQRGLAAGASWILFSIPNSKSQELVLVG